MQLSGIGIQELWPVLLLVFVLFGAKRIPELFRGLGEGMKEFKKATRELAEEESAPPPARPEPTGSTEARDETTRAGAGH